MQMLEGFGLEPDYVLNAHPDRLSTTLATLIATTDLVIQQCEPQLVLVHGDTTTALAAALSAYYSHIYIGHVEAGLRTYKTQPFPEEMHRQTIARLATFNYCPTRTSRQNLQLENVPGDIIFTGNTITDMVELMMSRPVPPEVTAIKNATGIYSTLLVTCHRRENWGIKLQELCVAIRHLLDHYHDLRIVWPVHSNTVIKTAVESHFWGVDRVILTDPLPYGAFMHLLNSVTWVLTDSGGVLEEASILGKTCLIYRGATERPESLQSSAIMITESGADLAPRLIHELSLDRDHTSSKAFGDGTAGKHIASHIVSAISDPS